MFFCDDELRQNGDLGYGENINIDIDKGEFDHGQLYVALSRTRKKSDMHICGRICKKNVIIDR